VTEIDVLRTKRHLAAKNEHQRIERSDARDKPICSDEACRYIDQFDKRSRRRHMCNKTKTKFHV